eukprot:g1108.t1
MLTQSQGRSALICACDRGRMNDVLLFVNLHRFHKYIEMNGVKEGNMTLKEMVNQLADPNIANSNGWNALHYAAYNNRTNTELIELLLTHMTLDNINKKNRWGSTPLDFAYEYNNSPIRQDIIALLRLKGGKANYYDENGRSVGEGNGDLNH